MEQPSQHIRRRDTDPAVIEANVEIVRKALASNRSGPAEETVEVAIALCDPGIEFTSRVTAVEGATYRGHEGARRYFRDMADAWQEWRNEPEETAEVAPDAVLAEFTFTGIGRGSGVKVELGSAGVFVLSEGRICAIHVHPTRREALRAAGLPE